MLDRAALARVLAIEVVVARFDIFDRNLPRMLVLLAIPPPLSHRVEFLVTNTAILGVLFHPLREWEFVVPDFFGRIPLLEKKKIRIDAGIGIEDALREADDRVEIAFGEKLLFDCRLHPLAKERPVREDDARAPHRFQKVDEEDKEKVRGFLGAEFGRKVRLRAVFDMSAEGRICHDHGYTIFGAVFAKRLREHVAAPDLVGRIHAMQDEIGNREGERKLFKFHAAD